MVNFAKLLITIFWICDITDMPFMEMFDTTYPMNALFWFLIFMFVYVPLDVESETKETRRQIEEERKTL